MATSLRRYNFDNVDARMRQGLETVFPAGVLLVAKNGTTIHHRAYGWLDPDTRQLPTQKESLFDLASLTKLFTATAFMTLVEKQFVGLDTPVSRVLPEFSGVRRITRQTDPHTGETLPPPPEFAGQTVDAAQITFRQLLTHTSGLDAWQDFCNRTIPAGARPLAHRVSPEMRRRRLDTFLKNPNFVYPPGKHFLYSDLGFIALGEAIERLSALSLGEFLPKSIFNPLGLESMGYNPLARGISKNTIAPTEFCRWRKRRIHGEVHDENAACLGGEAGHAGLFGTARDVAAFGQIFLDGAYNKSSPILSAKLLREMTRDQIHLNGERRGLGWKLQTEMGNLLAGAFSRHSFGHTGFTGTSLWVDPARNMLVVLLTNRVYRGRDNQSIADFRQKLHQSVATAIDFSSGNSL